MKTIIFIIGLIIYFNSVGYSAPIGNINLAEKDANNYIVTTLGTALNSTSDSIAVDFVSNAVVNIPTNTTTIVDANNGAVHGVIVNTAGTTSKAEFYDIASAGCSGTPTSGYLFGIQTTATTNPYAMMINHIFTNGICVVTTGGSAANISVLYKDLP